MNLVMYAPMLARELVELQKVIDGFERGTSIEEAEEYWQKVSGVVDTVTRDLRSYITHIENQVKIGRRKDYLKRGLEPPNWELPARYPEPLVDFRRLKSKISGLPDVAMREEAANNIAYELIGVAEEEVEKTGRLPKPVDYAYDTFPPPHPEPEAPLILLLPYWRSPDSAVVDDYEHWKIATNSWREKGESESAAEIERMAPPLSWAEVIYYYIQSLNDSREEPEANRRRKELTYHIYPELMAYCLECDSQFEIKRNNPGQLVCPKCNQNKRQRRRRANKKWSKQ